MSEVIFLNDKKKKDDVIKTPCMLDTDGQPTNAFEQVNFYGTYNIQPTQASYNTFPAVGQGLDKKTVEKLKEEADRWQKEDSKVPQRPGN